MNKPHMTIQEAMNIVQWERRNVPPPKLSPSPAQLSSALMCYVDELRKADNCLNDIDHLLNSCIEYFCLEKAGQRDEEAIFENIDRCRDLIAMYHGTLRATESDTK